jgi:peroxiredoxin
MMTSHPALLLVLAGLGLQACVPDLTSKGGNAGPWEPPENQWPLREPPANLVGTGFAEGQVPPDFRLVDQHGDEVSLWQFYGSVVLLDVSTMWCGPCQEVASHTEDTYEAFKDDGFMYLTVLHEDVENRPPNQEDLEEWAEGFDITAPVLADGDQATGAAVTQGQYPAVLVIGRDMTVIDRPRSLDAATIDRAIEDAL